MGLAEIDKVAQRSPRSFSKKVCDQVDCCLGLLKRQQKQVKTRLMFKSSAYQDIEAGGGDWSGSAAGDGGV